MKRDLLPASFNPLLAPPCPLAAAWLAEATLRLRRELGWLWHLQKQGTNTDALADSLDRLRHHDARELFFQTDPTAAWLGEQVAAARAQRDASPAAGSAWARVVQAARLDDAAQWVLALALAARCDAALGPVAAALQPDGARQQPTLALAQRLWPDPLALLPLADPSHPLYRHALLRAPQPADGPVWTQPLELPAALAPLLLGRADAWPPALAALPAAAPTEAADAVSHWLRAQPPTALQVVPMQLPHGSAAAGPAACAAAASGHRLAALPADLPADHPALPGLAAAAWLLGVDLLAPQGWADDSPTTPQATPLATALAPLAALPLRLWLPVRDATTAAALPARWLAPTVSVPPLTLAQRQATLAQALQGQGAEQAERLALDAAQRFRLNDRALAQVAGTLRAWPQAGAAELTALCRAAATLDMGQLAQPVSPRFTLAELVLPTRQAQQVRAIVQAMQALPRVHHRWGTGRAWNHGGLACLFCGPPGTGKTMACEALAQELGLPMVRIDLSQVVNKYIGETEKNLRRVFDAAEAADCLLLFDEADALFGKRTEVKDAHDRYANIEVSYLLERMERFKGLAVLATNRRKDIDEAFVRRLRFVVEFPLPGPDERARLWRGAFPPEVDVAALDFAELARRFELAGGPIRSAAFNACLLAAAAAPPDAPPAVRMPQLLQAVKHEIEKGGRELQREQFGPLGALLPPGA